MDEKRSRGRPRAFNDKTEQNTIKSLDRAMMILETLSKMEGATLTELATHVDQSAATVYRVLSTLQARGMVELIGQDQTWHIGSRCFVIGSSFLRRTSLVERARPFMRQLMDLTGETANLGVARGDHVMFLSQVETHKTIRAFFPPGTQSPLHVSGIGKAIIAYWPQDMLDGLMAAPKEQFTENTLITKDALLRDMERTRARGYAVDNEERHLGMRCVAAPIFDALGEVVGGISISGPSARVSVGAVPEIGAQVAEAAKGLSLGLGAQL
ncbi:HTH-type transcriptional regulator BhcR [Algirhabdus cladophorae]|uniref:HTH-type transcriptional regulator BhcR n=1 Tax=Algirhabdus cladophorae TaxID=3377108 RepID=UPI003B8484C1